MTDDNENMRMLLISLARFVCLLPTPAQQLSTQEATIIWLMTVATRASDGVMDSHDHLAQ
jgi:hypothetical protein